MTNRGSYLEKSSGRVFEVVCISVFLLSLFLTGCSPSLQAGRDVPQGETKAFQATGEATMPPAPNVLDASPTNSAAKDAGEKSTLSAGSTLLAGMTPSGLMSFIDQDVVAQRVRLVIGWLRFVRQAQALHIAETGWDRVQAGQIIEPLDGSAVHDRPDISKSELMLWRQILKQNPEATNPLPERRLEALAVALTVATTPDDLIQIDNLLVVSPSIDGY